MTKDFKRFYVSRAMFLGATMFLASIGIATANPSTDALGSAEPNPVVASPQQNKHVIKGVVEDQFGPICRRKCGGKRDNQWNYYRYGR